jgi:hypothetical protein
MNTVLMVSLLSAWIGFAVAHQIAVQSSFDATGSLGRGWRFWVGRALFGLVAVGGMLGLALLIGTGGVFKSPEFAISFCCGIALFLTARKLVGGLS